MTKCYQISKSAHNSTYKKLAVHWLNEVMYFVLSLVRADSFRLRNRQLLVATKRQAVKKIRFSVTQTRFVNFAWV